MAAQETYSAFEGHELLFKGGLFEVVMKVKKRLGKSENSPVLIFSDETGKTIDFNFQGTERDVAKRLEVFVSNENLKEVPGPGRPKLGVISREVSLLPRHWEWLATQSGGASATLRSLVEEARKKSGHSVTVKQAQERAYKFMSVMGGDFEGYEEALRALYKRDKKTFVDCLQGWPADIKKFAAQIAKPAFES